MKPGDLVIFTAETAFTRQGEICVLLEMPPPQRWFSSKYTFEEVTLLHKSGIVRVPKVFVKPYKLCSDDKAPKTSTDV